MGRGRQRIDSLRGRQKPSVGESEEKSTALGLEEAPVFYPTEEEFSDPLRFIAHIREEVEPYGICRIVPPKSWNPPFAIESQSFIFPTKHQSIHQLQERTAACDAETFKLEYGRYLESEGREMETWPEFEGEVLDLCKLYNAVKRHGGYKKLRDESKWGEVFRMMRDDASHAPVSDSVLASLCQLYDSHLHGYEVHQANVSAGKLLRMTKRQVIDVKCKGKRAGRKRQREGDQEEAQIVKRRSGIKAEIEDGEETEEAAMEPVTLMEAVSLTTTTETVVIQESRTDQICEQCHSGAHEKSMLLCDRCNRGWHIYCLSPPLPAIPHGNWYCLECLASANDSFGFAQGKEYSYDSFQRYADRFKRKWFSSTPPKNSDVENDFWRIVERATAPVEVLYGSDIDTGLYGSGFPRASDPVQRGCDPEDWQKYITNPWNLNNFPKLEDSMLRMVQDNIPGVIVPWLYMGMLFSSFCWHYEDHCLYSVNYLHRGAPKTWYSVPGSAASAFEEVMQKSFPDLFEAQPDLLFQLVTMLNPTVLRDSDVPVCTTTQEPGNFVITFPRSYHGGFNHGFNCAEAVNFAPADWLPLGGFAVERYRFYHKAAVLSHDELLCVVAKNKVSAVAKPFVQKELGAIIKRERAQREQLWINGVVKSSRMAPRACEDHISTEEDPMCIICRYYLHLSALVCSCRPARAVCLQHARQLCECPTDRQRLLYRHSLAELDDLLLEHKENADDSKVGDLAAVSKPSKRNLRRGASSLNQSVSKKVMGRVVRHTDLAEKWLDKVQRATQTTRTVETLENLLLDSEQFLWAGHEMDPVREVQKTLSSARKWADELAKCWTTIESYLQGKESRLPKVPFAVVQRLVAAGPVPCVEPYLPLVKALFETAKCLQQQIINFTLMQPPLPRASLEALIKEATLFPLDFLELSGLQQLVNSAKVWSERVRKLLPPIKALRNRNLVNLDQLLALQQEGLKLPVKVEDKEILDLVILKAEALQQKVSVMLGLSLPLQEVEEVVRQVQELPVQVPGLQELEQGLADARAWLLRVRPTLAHIHHYNYSTSITLLTDLLAPTSNLRVQLDDVKTVETSLKKIQWLDSASKALEKSPSTKELVDLLSEATSLQLSKDKLVIQIQELAQTALSWESKTQHALKLGDTHDNFVELISSAGNMNIRLEGLSALKNAIAEASSWKEEALAYVNKRQNFEEVTKERLELSTLQALVGKAQTLTVRLEESSLLQTYWVEAQAWILMAAELTASVRCVLLSSVEVESSYTCDAAYSRALLSQLEEHMLKLEKALKEGLELGLDFPAIAELEILLTVTQWSIRALHVLHTRPQLENAKVVLNESKAFQLETRPGALLQGAIQIAESWKQKVEEVVPLYGKARTCTKRQLEQLLSEAQALPVSIPNEVLHIHNALASHSLWQKQVHQALDGVNGCMTREELLQLQDAGLASWLESDEKQELSSVLADVDFWLSSFRDAVAAPSADPSMSVKELLSQMYRSVVRASQRVEGEEMNCVCGETLHRADASMLHCDSCDDWYHPTCLGLSPFQTRAQKQYICPYCSALSSGFLALNDDAYIKIHVSQRPPLSLLVEFLNSASSIPCRMEEFKILEELVSAVHDWQCQLSDIIEPALVQYPHSTAVDVCSLLRALKAVEGMELQEEASCRVKLAVMTNAWRTRALNLLDGTVKPSLRYISKSIKEAAAVPVADDDCILQDLKFREARASNWISHARQVIGDEGKAALEEVRALIAEGESISVSVSRELSALRTRSLLYCICRKPYDKQQAMIACDRCGEWYHYSCLNLPEPEPEDSDESSLIQHDGGEFVCPDCQEARHVWVPQHHKEVYSRYYKEDTEEDLGEPEAPQAPVTPETPKEMEVPQAGLRGKRSSRGKTKAVQQSKWQLSHVLMGSEKSNNNSSSSEAETPTSGRPCRRTAGRHSGFDNYVLLTRSR